MNSTPRADAEKFIPPTSLERAIALPLAYFFNALVWLLPVRWLIRHTGSLPPMTGRVAFWAYSRAYFYNERFAGRL